MSPIRVGEFVRLKGWPEAEFGTGKVVAVEGRSVTVAYCDVPGAPEAHRVTRPERQVEPVSLDEQTRVYRFDEASNRWEVGRVLDGEGGTCLVAFPNGNDRTVPREELYVRWRKAIENPTEFLARGLTETPLFGDKRQAFIRSVNGQQSACLGMGAALSSNVELQAYQFAVVQRVLQDPVQRYLLADEVGLGKTIEAGVIIRQFVLDDPSARVLVVVPPALVGQWRQELKTRFALGDWLDEFVLVLPSNDVMQVGQVLPDVGMLVVDEAHHLSRQSQDGTNPLYDLIRQHSSRVPRLLLLSATPVLADTAGYLRMLHLLDPVVFPLDDLQGFENRLQARQVVAEVAAALVPENFLAMEDDLDRIAEHFGHDELLMEKVDALRPIVQTIPQESDRAYLSALGELRSHLTETYKLHRRILRNRRKAVPRVAPGRSGLTTERYTCARQRERHSALEELRVHLVNTADQDATTATLFPVAVHPSKEASVERMLHDSGVLNSQTLQLAREVDRLTTACADTRARQSAVGRAVLRQLEIPGVQVVVFCDAPRAADALTEALRHTLHVEVLRHQWNAEEDEDNDAPWRRFLTDPGRCRVLVCDAAAEEGLNLHGGRKVVVHYDLPAEPNRIEQRLGRLDRFGGGTTVHSVAVVCADDPSELAWVQCLAQGLRVFDTSMATLQYLVEDTLTTAVADWANEGAIGLNHWREELSGPDGWVARELRRIDQQDILDSLGAPTRGGFTEMKSADENWGPWKEAFEGFVKDVLHFDIRTQPWPEPLENGNSVFRLKYARPQAGHRTLLTLPDFVERFISTIDVAAPGGKPSAPLTYLYGYDRKTALSNHGRASGLRPLRHGDSLVQSLYAFCQEDDRGRSFAMWREIPGAQMVDASGVDLWFRFDFLIEANLPEPFDDETRATHRRAGHVFQPLFQTVWVPMVGRATVKPAGPVRRGYVKGTYQGITDTNLNPQRWQSLVRRGDVVWLPDWRQHCESALNRGRSFLSAQDSLTERVSAALDTLRLQHETRRGQLESRIARLDGGARDSEARELDRELTMHQLLLNAIGAPRLRVDTAGAIFVSARAFPAPPTGA